MSADIIAFAPAWARRRARPVPPADLDRTQPPQPPRPDLNAFIEDMKILMCHRPGAADKVVEVVHSLVTDIDAWG